MRSEAKAVRQIRTELELARQSVRAEMKELSRSEEAVTTAIGAQTLLSGLAKAVQQKAHKRIASVVSSCLSAVFDEPYEFRINFEQKRGRTEAQLKFYRDGHELDPMEAAGLGTVDVASFALRAVCLVLHRPRLRRLLVLDEPFKFVSEEYQPAVRSMLEQLSRDLDLQIVMVTHNKEYETGKIIKL
jgi:DNA repair exonuclease SbcCD ATPase subunit